jgi:hypothetical protein
MDILGLLGNPVKYAVEMMTSAAIGAAIYLFIKKELQAFGNTLILETKNGINNVNDPDLRKLLEYGIHYVSKRFPEASNNAKLQILIKAVQDATPNLIISDDQIRTLIEDQYDEIKDRLSKL